MRHLVPQVTTTLPSWSGVIKWKHFSRYRPFERGESTGDQWIPLTKAIDAELWCFLWSAPQQTVEQRIETPVIWDTIVLIMTSLQWSWKLSVCSDQTSRRNVASTSEGLHCWWHSIAFYRYRQPHKFNNSFSYDFIVTTCCDLCVKQTHISRLDIKHHDIMTSCIS